MEDLSVQTVPLAKLYNILSWKAVQRLLVVDGLDKHRKTKYEAKANPETTIYR